MTRTMTAMADPVTSLSQVRQSPAIPSFAPGGPTHFFGASPPARSRNVCTAGNKTRNPWPT